MRGNSLIAKTLCLLVLLNGLVLPSGAWARTAPGGQVDDAILRQAGLTNTANLQSVTVSTGNEQLTILLDSAALDRTVARQAGTARVGVAIFNRDGGTIYWPYDVQWGAGGPQLRVHDSTGETLGTRPFPASSSRLTHASNIHLRPAPCDIECVVAVAEVIIDAVKIIIDIFKKKDKGKDKEDEGDGSSIATGGSGTWTPWLNRDNPAGSGDYETLKDFLANGQGCPQPLDVQCQTLDGRDWNTLNRPYICNTEVGGVCRNQDQPDRRCPNFRVRFRCP